MISPRDFLLMIVRAQLGDTHERDEDVVDALMMWGLGTIQMSATSTHLDSSMVRMDAQQPNGDHVWCRQWIAPAYSSTTLAEIFGEMNGRTMRRVHCEEHGSGRGVCCLAAEPLYPLEPIQEMS